MQFVDHDVFEVDKKLLPLGVVRQNARVQHVGIGDDNVPLPADGPARVIGCIAVISEGFDVGLQIRNQTVGFVHLVLRQRLGGKQIKRARFRLVQNALQHRQVIAKRFAAGRGCNQHNIPAAADKAHGLRLMLVQPLHPALDQNVTKVRAYPGRVVFKISGFGWNINHRSRVGVEAFVFFQAGDPFVQGEFGHG